MSTLAEYMIVADAKNRPPMLDKTMYNSWESRLSLDVYGLVNHCQSAKDIWERVKLLMKGTELSYQEHKCKLYNEFDKFASVKRETLHEYYLHFAQLINDMHTIGMTMQQVQLYAYRSQHEAHANELRMMHERYLDPLTLVANSQTQLHSAQYPQQLSSTSQTTYSSQPFSSTYATTHHLQQYQQGFQPPIKYSTPSVPHNAYHIIPL
ncbi:hypothetical protein Tco_1455776 [Tanacetum coccineum]